MKVGIVVFLKAPRPGWVKTRLAATLGKRQACDAYCRIAHSFLSRLRAFSNVELRFAPDDAVAEISPFLLRPEWSTQAQGTGDLGVRLERALSESLETNDAVLMFGSDCPYIESGDVEAAIDQLHHHDIVLGPALDGGYWMIGLKGNHADMFRDIPWSTEQVLEASRKRADTLGLSVAALRPLEDVDDLSSWQRLQPHLERPNEA